MLHNHGWGKNTKNSETKKSPAGKETHQKKSCRGSKGPFQMYMASKKQQLNLNYKNNKRIGKPDNWSTENWSVGILVKVRG